MFGSLNCKACGTYVAPNTKACPGCGKKRGNAKKILAGVVVAEFLALGAGVYWWTLPKPAAPGLQTLAAADAVISDMTYRGGWTFYTTHDGAVNDVTRHARLLSDASATAGSIATKATLELRDSATYGKVVLLSFPSMPSECSTSHCTITASFDNGEPQSYDMTLNTDDATTTVAVPQFQDFVTRLGEAHNLAITVALGTASDLVFKFTVAGFGWA
jgi:hypothetical protein